MAIEPIRTKQNVIRYRVTIWSHGQKQDTATFGNEKLAREWEAQRKVELEKEVHLPDKPKKLSFENLFNEWIESNNGKKSYSSLVMERRFFQNHFFSFADLDLKEFRPRHFDVLVNRLRKTKLKPASINRILAVAKAVFNFGVSRRYLSTSPMVSIKMLTIQSQPFGYWSFDEASVFLSHCRQKYRGNERWIYLFYVLLLKTGCRFGEAAGLRWNAILFNQDLILIDSTLEHLTGIVKATTKGRRSRYVPLPKDLKIELLQTRQHGINQLVFVSKNGQPIDLSNFRGRHFKKDLKACGVRSIRIHDLRHTFASQYMMNGGNLYDLQQILGHAGSEMTQRYAHLAPNHIASKREIVTYESDRLKQPENVLDVTCSLSRPQTHILFTSFSEKGG